MPDSTKATRATVAIGGLSIGLTEWNAREFLQSKALKSLRSEGYTPALFEIESDDEQRTGGSRIRWCQ